LKPGDGDNGKHEEDAKEKQGAEEIRPHWFVGFGCGSAGYYYIWDIETPDCHKTHHQHE
jgi:hypothetical protein